MRLKDKVAIVTGATSGIGEATAKLFAREGARVVVSGRSEERGAKVVDTIEEAGGQAVFVPADLRFQAECESVARAAIASFGKVDILFNNAGVCFTNRDILQTTEEEWNMTMDVNAKGIFLLSKAVIPHMLEHGGGVIVNTASVWGLRAGNGAAAYCASKGAVVQLTRAMALDFARRNIRVNAVCPGSVDTPMLRQEMEELGGEDRARPLFAAKHPMNAIASPQQVAEAVLFLVSDSASFITGACLAVDGGRSAGEVLVVS